jgi:putative ABC transport system substrate-binding protein
MAQPLSYIPMEVRRSQRHRALPTVAGSVSPIVSLPHLCLPSRLDDPSAIFDREGPGALLVSSDPFFIAQRNQLIAVAARCAIPSVYNERKWWLTEACSATGRASPADIIKPECMRERGAKPADLSVIQPTRFELVINQKTAKTLVVAIPPTLLATDDEVIE